MPCGLCERCWSLVEGVKDVDVDGVAVEHREALENVDLIVVSIRPIRDHVERSLTRPKVWQLYGSPQPLELQSSTPPKWQAPEVSRQSCRPPLKASVATVRASSGTAAAVAEAARATMVVSWKNCMLIGGVNGVDLNDWGWVLKK